MDALMGYGSGSDSEALDDSMANLTVDSEGQAVADEVDASKEEDALTPKAASEEDLAENMTSIKGSAEEIAPAESSESQDPHHSKSSEGGHSLSSPVATSNSAPGDKVTSPLKDGIPSTVQDTLAEGETPQVSPPLAILGSPLAKSPSKSPLLSPSSPTPPQLLDQEAAQRLAEDAAAGPWGDQLDCLGGSLNCALDCERLGVVKCPSSSYGEYGSLKVLCSRSAHLVGMTADKEGAIVLGRKCVIDADAMLRGDLARVQLGAHCFVGLRTVLRPPRRIAFAEDTTKPSAPRSAAGSLANAEVTGSSLLFNSPPASPPPPPPPARVCMWTKLVVGSHVVFGRDCVVEASSVGSFVRVGDGCVLGAGCIVKDCVWLMPGTLLPPGTIVAPFSIMSGAPAQRVGELPESAAEEFRLHAERTCRRRVYQKV